MSTYFKYAERDATTNVNWAEISSNMVDTLNEAVKIREDKKAAIDKATNELSSTLADAPQGEHAGLNEFALTFANNAQEMRLMQDKLLKSGQLSLKDYNIGRANLTQGTTQLFDLSKKYQEEYQTKMDRFELLESAQQEQWMMAELEGFANFSNHSAIINPTNGQVSVGKFIQSAKKDKQGYDIPDTTDGVYRLDTNPSSYTTVQQLNFAVSDQVNRYKMDAFDTAIDQWANSYKTALSSTSTIDDVRQNPAFKQAKNDLIEGQLVDSRQVGSILTDYVGMAANGKAYTFTRNPEEAGKNVILLEEDPRQPGSGRLVPKLDKEQTKAAYDYLDTQVEIRFGRTETKKEPSASLRSTIEGDAENVNLANNIGQLYYGTDSEIDAAIGFLQGLDEDIVAIERDEKGVYVTYTNGNKKEFGFYSDDENKKIIAQDDWITGIVSTLSDIKDVKKVLGSSDYKKKKKFNRVGKGYFQVDQTKGQIAESLDNYLNTYFEENADAGSDSWSGEEDFIDNATTFFKSLGFDVEEASNPFDNDVNIILPAATKEDNELKFTFNPRDFDDPKKGTDALIAWMKSNMSTEQIEELIKLEVIPAIARTKNYRVKSDDIDSRPGGSGVAGPTKPAGIYECVNGMWTDKETGLTMGECNQFDLEIPLKD